MLSLRYIIASLVLLTSGVYFASNISSLSQANEESSEAQKSETVLENTFFTLNKATSNLYLQKLAESIASEVLGQNVHVVVE